MDFELLQAPSAPPPPPLSAELKHFVVHVFERDAECLNVCHSVLLEYYMLASFCSSVKNG